MNTKTPEREIIIVKGWICDETEINPDTIDEKLSFFRIGSTNRLIIGDVFIYLKKYSESYSDERKTAPTKEWASLPHPFKIDNFTQVPDAELLQKFMTDHNIKDDPKTIWVHHYIDTTDLSTLGGFRPVNRDLRRKKSTTTTN